MELIDKIIAVTENKPPMTYYEIGAEVSQTYHQVRKAVLRYNDSAEQPIVVNVRPYMNLEHMTWDEIQERKKQQKREAYLRRKELLKDESR